MFKNKSGSWRFSKYDIWGAIRGVLFFVVAGLVVNIGAFESWISGFSINPFFITMIVWGVLDFGRRVATDYTK